MSESENPKSPRKRPAAKVSRLDPNIQRRLNEFRSSLMPLHKGLLDFEKREYERTYGRQVTPGELVRLALTDPWFAWLRKISEMIVRIDQLLEDEAATADDAFGILQQARAMFRPRTDAEAGEPLSEFQERYKSALQKNAGSVLAHVEMQRALFTDS